MPALISAKKLGIKQIYIPHDPLIPIHMLEGLECVVVQHIEEVVNHLGGQGSPSFFTSSEQNELTHLNVAPYPKDFRRVIGHEYAKRALEMRLRVSIMC